MTENATYCDKHVSSRKCIFFVVHAGARLLRPTISRPSPPCHRHPCAMKPKARPLTSSAVPPRHAAVLPSTRAAGGAASMHATYEEDDKRVLQHTGEEELACHCRLRPRGGGAHGGCRGGSRSHARRARKPGAYAESTFQTLNATWILQSEGAIWVSRLM